MKKLLLIIGISSLAYSCQKKQENPTPAETTTTQEQTTATTPTVKSNVKVTTWSNKLPYIYRRLTVTSENPFVAVWKDDTVRTNTGIFYEAMVNNQDYLETTVQVVSMPMVTVASVSVTAEYLGKKTVKKSETGQTFAVVFLKNIK